MPEHETKSGPVGEIIGDASLSYAFCFFTILTHTAQLGVPIVDLAEPLYVWVGLPIAAVTFFWKQILRWLNAEVLAGTEAYKRAFATTGTSVDKPDVGLAATTLAVFDSLPILG